jgi:integrase
MWSTSLPTDEHSSYLRGADVVLIPDNDEPGRDHIVKIAKLLREHRIRQMEQRLALGLGRLEPDALVFSEMDGKPLSPRALSGAWRRTCVALGIPRVTFHALRHTHASALIAAGLDVVTISRRLGHANPTVTLNTYAHLFSKSDTLAAAAIEAAMGMGGGNGQGVKK